MVSDLCLTPDPAGLPASSRPLCNVTPLFYWKGTKENQTRCFCCLLNILAQKKSKKRKKEKFALAGVAQLVGVLSQRPALSEHMPRLLIQLLARRVREATNWCFSLTSMFLFPPTPPNLLWLSSSTFVMFLNKLSHIMWVFALILLLARTQELRLLNQG